MSFERSKKKVTHQMKRNTPTPDYQQNSQRNPVRPGVLELIFKMLKVKNKTCPQRMLYLARVSFGEGGCVGKGGTDIPTQNKIAVRFHHHWKCLTAITKGSS